MFDDYQKDEEKNANKLLMEFMPPIAKKIIATAIFAGMKAAREFWQEHPSLPKGAYYDAACQLRFIIYRTVAKMAENIQFSRMSYVELTGSSSPLFIIDSVLQIQFKKAAKKEMLPEPVYSRTIRSEGNKQLSLPFGTEYDPAVYCLVTYNHSVFNLKYMQIGIPDEKYEKWVVRENLIEYIDKELVERIEKEYVPKVKEEVADNISKKYRLTIKE